MMELISKETAIKAVTMLLDDPDDVDKIWSCDVINNLKYAPTVSGWISVDDATPDKDGEYLTWHGQSPMIQAFGLTGADLIGMNTWIDQKGGWWSIEMNRPIVGITYWQPLPEPPKEDYHEAD